jgi:hypothetical protein
MWQRDPSHHVDHRHGDGHHEFKDFEKYLLPPPRFSVQREKKELGLAVDTDCNRFLGARLRMIGALVRAALYIHVFTQAPDSAIVHTSYIHFTGMGHAHHKGFQEWQLAGGAHPS